MFNSFAKAGTFSAFGGASLLKTDSFNFLEYTFLGMLTLSLGFLLSLLYYNTDFIPYDNYPNI
jgi:hypothetical protein